MFGYFTNKKNIEDGWLDFYKEFDGKQKRIVNLTIILLFAFMFTIIYIGFKNKFKDNDTHTIASTKDLIQYDTIYYFQLSKPDYQIKFTNYKVYYFSFYSNSGTYLHKIIKQGDIVYKDSNSNEMKLIKGSQTFTGYFNADTNNLEWKKKKLINYDIYK